MFEHVTVTYTPGVDGVGVGVSAADGVAAGAAVAVDVGVAGRSVRGTVDPQAARPMAAIAVPTMIVILHIDFHLLNGNTSSSRAPRR
jgi:hypothetical protein